MAWKRYNSNPTYQSRGDCVIRAISKVFNFSWDQTYIELCIQGFLMKEWGNSNNVWDAYLRGKGFTRKVIPNTCPDCYTIKDFCFDNPDGEFILATGSHVVAVINGDYYDSWDSRDESKNTMINHLQEVADMAMDEKDRKAVMRLIEQMEMR